MSERAALTPHPVAGWLVPTSFRQVVVRTAWLYAASVPALNTVMVPGVGTLSRVAGILFAGAGVLAVVVEDHRRPWREAQWFAVGLLAWCTLSVLWSVDPAATQVQVFTLAQTVLTFLLLWEFCRTLDEVRGMLRGYVIGAAVMGVRLLHGALTAVEDPTRYTVVGVHPNSLAFVLALGIPMSWYLSVTATGRIERLAAGLYPALAAAAIIFTASRSALLVTAMALLVIPLMAVQTRSPRQLLGITVVVVGLAGILAVAPAKPIERLGTATEEIETAELAGRAELWRASSRALVEAPYVGVGLGSTDLVLLREIGLEKGSHNSFLAVTLEVGFLGLLLFLLLFAACLLPSFRLRGTDRILAVVLGATLVLGLLPRHWHMEKPTWLVLALLCGLGQARTGHGHTPFSNEASTGLRRAGAQEVHA